MTAPARFYQTDIERILKAAKNAGYPSVRLRIDGNGEIEALVGAGAEVESPEEMVLE